MKEHYVTEFKDTMDELLQTLSSFDQPTLNRQPFEGSWTAGQVGEHVLQSLSGLPKVLQGPSKATDRNPYEKAGLLESIFLDFTTQMKSPEFILPSSEEKNKEAMITRLRASIEETKALLPTTDLSRTFTGFLFPAIGELTGWEWVCFAVCHTKRHIRQMSIISEKLLELQ